MCHFGQIIDPQIICDKIVVMPLLPGHTVQAAREATAVRIAWNPEKASDLFAFMLWVGDEDRGLDDGMLVGDQIVLIDNGLCGPGAGLSLRSYHPYPEHYQYENRVKMCYGGKQSFVAYVLRDMRFPSEMLISPSAIARIEKISDDVIREVVVIVGLPTQICDKLIERKRALLDDYRTWLAQASDVCKPHSS